MVLFGIRSIKSSASVTFSFSVRIVMEIRIDDYGSLNLFSLSFDSGAVFVRVRVPSAGGAI